jgi:acyl carrier protein
MMSDDVRRDVRNFIEDSFLYMHPDVQLADGEPLLERGLIDSLGFVELVEEVQARYGIQVQDTEITEENFGSIDSVVAYVARKRNTA